MKIYGRLFSYVFRHPVLFTLCVVFAVSLVVGKVGGMLQIGSFFSAAFIEQNMANISVWDVLKLVGLAFLWAGSHYLVFLCSNTLATRVMHDIRRDLYARLVDQPLSYFRDNRTGDILSRLLNDISVVEIFLMNIMVEMIAQPLTVITIVAIMFYKSPQISWYFFSIVPVLAIVLGGLGGLVQKLSARVQKNISDITSSFQETVYGMEVIQGHGIESEFRDRFFLNNDAYLKAIQKEIRIRLLGTPSAEFLGSVGIIIILVLGSLAVSGKIASPQDVVNFILLATVLSEPLAQTSGILMILRKLSPAASRIFEIVDSKPSVPAALPTAGRLSGRIVYDNVGFTYGREQVLTDIGLTIEPGETIAIVGHSGAGKTTLLSLIPRFNTATSGRLLLDGQDITALDPNSVRRQLGVVTQEPILFAGTIRDNIRLARPDAADAEIKEAAALANAHGFVSALPEGYDTLLGDRGVRISGGERQRIVLARAILRRPRILLLDEATSSLDAESEKAIQEAMKHILGSQTTLIVAHKLSTIASADRIVVMEKGRIIEVGSHKELVEKGGIYNRLYSLQVTVS